MPMSIRVGNRAGDLAHVATSVNARLPTLREQASMIAESSAAPRQAAFAFVFVTVLLDMLALGMVIPVLPKLIESFLAGDTARASEFVGLFASVWALMQFVVSPVQGALSDRFGRRPVILVSNFGLGLD